jgi:hypothetical protein
MIIDKNETYSPALTLNDDYRPLDNLNYILQTDTSVIELTNGSIKEKNHYESHLTVTEGVFELLNTPFSKIYNKSEDSSFVLILYVNASKDFEINYTITGNINNLYQSIQEIDSSVEPTLLLIDNNTINETITFNENNKSFIFKLSVPNNVQVNSLILESSSNNDDVYIIIQQNTDVIILNDLLVIDNNYIETSVNFSTTVKEIIPIERWI